MFLLIVLFIIFFALILPKPGAPADNGSSIITKRDRKCPPHTWFWQEVIDEKGVKVGERICCKFCGPLKPIGGASDES